MFLITLGFGWLWSIFSTFWFWLDSTILDFITDLYNLLMMISRTSILSQATIHEFASRIQMLLGIFMLFKVSFSLIMYVVNPDDFSDKSKGVGKLAQNTIISLVLLAIVPYIFNMAYKLQAMILEDNTLGRLILGSANEKDYVSDAGELMAYEVMIPFLKPNTAISKLLPCVQLKDGDKFNDECYNALQSVGKIADNSNDNGNASTLILDNYKNGVEQKSLGLTFRLSAINLSYEVGDDNEYVFEYRWPITTVVGVVVCLLLLSFCIDISIRSVKLAFLQLIAPVPIISYMDPKSGKDGMFAKWYKMCFSTYISLFVRLLALYFGIYIIGQLDNLYDNVNGGIIDNSIVKIFIIIGVLFFIKQLPKILENLGIKLDGDGKFTLNPFKKMEDGMFGYKAMKNTAKGATGAAMGLGMGIAGAATGAGVGKAFTGMFKGASDGLKGKKLGEIHKGQVDANKRMREAIDNGSTFWGRRQAQLSNLTGSRGQQSAIERFNKTNFDDPIKQLQDNKKRLEDSISNDRKKIDDKKSFADSIKAMEERAKSEIEAGNSYVGRAYLEKKAEIERLKNIGASSFEISRAEAEANNYLNDVGLKEYMGAASYGSIDDKTFKSLEQDAIQKGHTVGVDLEVANAENMDTYGGDLHSLFGKTKGEIGEASRAIYDVEREIASVDDQVRALEVEKQNYNNTPNGNRTDIAKANESAINH